MHWFVTGTGTDVGKTYVTALLLTALKRAGRRAAGFKPFCCGDRGDAVRLQEAGAAGLTLDQINPVWLKVPAAPCVAALMENRRIDLAAVRSAFDVLAAGHETVLVEGAGGWEVPLAPGVTVADFAGTLALPVIVIADNKLGALNHTLLTIRNIETRGLKCAGIILNHVCDVRDAASISNRATLEAFTSAPVLAEVMHGETEMDWPLG
ncbi:MAG: dethiobiotin synthase [Verrucomicrobiaceae bacterium]|nr:dethiobiotin synthase [Verrucomicrobiaceae bacterium]